MRTILRRLLIASWGIPMSWCVFFPVFALMTGVKKAARDVEEFNRYLWEGM